MKKHLFLLWLLIYISGAIYGNPAQWNAVQQYSFHFLDMNHGLGSNQVTSILEDKEGFIWIATRVGVDRFDGKTIKNYALYTEEEVLTKGRFIFYILNDHQGNLWTCSSSGRAYKYNKILDTFELKFDFSQLAGKYLYINSVFIDSRGDFWISETASLYRYNSVKGIESIISDRLVNSVLECDEKIYIAAIDGLYEYDIRTKETCPLLSGMHIQSLFFDPKQSLLWIGTFNAGVYLYDTVNPVKKQTEAIASLPHYPCRTIIEYSDSILLLGIDGKGIYYVKRDGNYAQHVLSAMPNRHGTLNDNGVYCIHNDSMGNLWIGTYGGGVNYLIPKRFPYENIIHEEYNEQSICSNNVNRVLKDRDGNTWFATNDGISVLQKKTNKWHHLFRGQVFLTICEDGMGHIWAGGYGCGLYCVDIETLAYQLHSHKKDYWISTDYIYSIACDEDKELWLGGIYGALMRYNPRTKACSYYKEIDLVNSIEIVNADTIAIATPAGFYLVEKKTENISHFFYDLTESGVKSNVFIQSMTFAPPHKVWLGTDGGGLNLLDLRTKKAVNYSDKDGLPSNYILGTQFDEKGRLWVVTDKGLAYITDEEEKNLKIHRIGFFDQEVKNISRSSFSRLDDKRLAYGSTGGAFIFEAAKIENKPYSTSLHFTSFEMIKNNQNLAPEREKQYIEMLNKDKCLNLNYDENAFIISFTSVNYTNQEDILYSYKMEGMDEEWSLPNTVQQIRYTNIPSGHYNFTVKCISKNTNEVLDVQSVRIQIGQPYWNTPYAWLVYSMLLFGLVYFAWRYFANRMARKHFAEKIDFFVNTAHDIRTPVTLIMAPLSELKNEKELSAQGKDFLAIAIHNTERLFRLINQLLDFQKFDNNKAPLQVMKYDLNAYLHLKYIEFQPLCERKNISLLLNIGKETVYLWFDKEKMNKIIDNLLSNAVKYTPNGGAIQIDVVETEKNVQIKIEDTGIGIPQKAQKHLFTDFYRASNAISSQETGSGIGLLLTKKLVYLHKGSISYESVENQGTVFKVVFKKGFAHLAKYVVTEELPTQEEKRQPSVNVLSGSDESQPTLCTANVHKSMLIVEDNDELRFYLSKVFGQDYKVTDYPDCESALAYLSEHEVDIIISDVMLPGMQGDEFCRQLKSNFETSHIPIILLTARTEKDAIIKGLESGADDYLTKPFDTDVLKMKVKGILLNRQALSRNMLTTTSITESKETVDENIPFTQMDQDFLKQCTCYVKSHMTDPDFTIVGLCREFAMSRTLFYSKLKSLTGQSPNEFIRTIRLTEAAELLHQHVPVQDVAEKVGFTDAKYFSTVFKKHYGVSPSKY